MSVSFYLRLEIPIEPVAAVRPKVTRWNTYYPGKYGKYLPELREWLKVHCGEKASIETVLEVTAQFELRRPKSHFGSGKNCARVKPSAPALPHQDVDNLAKGLLDGLSGCAYEDDKQVARLVCEKRYGEGRTVVEIREV